MMARKNIQGITPNGKGGKQRRSIREIEREDQNDRQRSSDNGGADSQSGDRDGSREPKRSRKGRKSRGRGPSSAARWGMWFMILVGIAFIFFLFTTLSSGVEVIADVRTQSVDVAGSYTASRSASGADLQYETMSVTRAATTDVEATGSEYQETEASGEIEIINNFSAEPQTLVATTRFETADGLVYRIPEAVTVPGMSGGEPGTVVTTVVADAAGSEYNAEQAEFTIPGFAGTPAYEGFSAQTVTPLTGGAAGEVPAVSDADASTAQEELQTQLREQLAQAVRAQKPDMFLLFDGATFYEFSDLSTEATTDEADAAEGRAQVRQEATAHAIIFDRQALAEYLARADSRISYSDGEVVTLREIDNIEFAVENPEEFSVTAADEIDFQLTGEAQLMWEFDATTLAEDLAGKDKADIENVLSGYPGIAGAEIVMRPFWQQSFPQDSSEIKITRVVPGGDASQANAVEPLTDTSQETDTPTSTSSEDVINTPSS